MAEKFVIQKLNGRNWQTWSIRMEALLSREDLWSVVADDIPVVADRKPEWVAQDRKARSTMLLFLEDNQLPLVKDCVHAKTLYEKLRSYHQKTTRSFRVSILKRLCSTNLTECGDLEQHVMELDELFDRLQAAGMELAKEIRVCMLLRSLPSSFDHLVAALDLQSDDDLTLETVKSKLSDEYHRRQERDGGAEVEKAMRTTEQRERVCYKCRKPGHIMRHCRSGNKRSDVTSMEGKRDEAKAATLPLSDMQSVAFTAGQETVDWVIDSGASEHMTHDRSMFTSLREFAGGWISMADGKKVQIRGLGTVLLHRINGDGDVVEIRLEDVEFAPDLRTNLISVSQLARKGMQVSFDINGCQVLDRSGYVVAIGERRGGLYFLWQADTSTGASAGQQTEDCQHLWHRRLGHRDWESAGRINKEQLATCMEVSDCGIRSVCESCLEGESASAPLALETEQRSSQILDVVNTFLGVPMQSPTPDGARYVMHLIDDFGQYTFTFLLKRKLEAMDMIKEYVQWTEKRFGRKLLAVCSDGSGEMSNRSSCVELPAADAPAAEKEFKLWPILEEPDEEPTFKEDPSAGWLKRSTPVEWKVVVAGDRAPGKEEHPYHPVKEPSKFNKSTKCRGLVGGLMYKVCTATRDFAVSQRILGRKFSASNEAGSTAAKSVLWYQTRWTYSDDPDTTTSGTSVADWVGDLEKLGLLQ